MLSIHCETVLIHSKEFFGSFVFFECKLANLRTCKLFKLANLQTCKLSDSQFNRSHFRVTSVDHTCESHLLVALVSCAYLNHTFESHFSIALSITLCTKLTLRACERMQVPFNVWVYLSVRFKPQEK